jgi:transcriptional regulator with XRE-family HTH domain
MDMTASEFRHAHLVLMIEKSGTAQAFAERVGLAPSYISQLVNNKTPGGRGIGDKLARKIEAKLGMPKGAMDLPPAGSSDVQLIAILSSLPEDKVVKAMSDLLPQLSPEGLRQLSAAFLSQLTAPAKPKE